MARTETAGRQYIWICRWQEFQHYAPDRDRAPAWIKNYTKQLDDDDYRTLTADQRGLLHDLRIAFSRSHGKLTTDTRQLCHRFGYRVMTRQLVTLSHAGFIELVSREGLEQRLEAFYASRARDRVHEEEVEKDGEQEQTEDHDEKHEEQRSSNVVTEARPPQDDEEPVFEHAETNGLTPLDYTAALPRSPA